MSQAFSAFDNTQQNQALFLQALGRFGFNRLDFLAAHEPFRRGAHESLQHFKAQLVHVKDRFNLDQSEAARRIVIDLFLAEALPAASFRSIVTTEFSINASATTLGHGRLDYFVSSIDAHNGRPIAFPSIVIEAKKDLTTPLNANQENGQWQVLAELVTLAELNEQNHAPRPTFLRGIFTDGRHWNFIEFCLGLAGGETNRMLTVAEL